ncbi:MULTISPECIES: undecaprenyl-diphosphatase [Pantoea]|nr:undecaprenyl-diphosphatase [Pantoea ananatis]AER33063.1 membrane-associated phospholipid phosphatase YbjG [Pantoea ananatis PA13]MDF7792414.1 undecaprenyl-diphosphatase [Pantoea ananatis]PQK94535.1 undecaprenyl-diphosphatase [Pantoea ananatis]REE67853.1 undecaprenyl-diphosphatase [Pantoea ananatis]
MDNITEVFNQNLFLKINAPVGTPDWLIDFAVFSAEYLIFFIPVIVLLHWFTGRRRERETALFVGISGLTALSISMVCSVVYFHPRPFMMGLGHLWIDHVPNSSFPSDHGTLFFSVALALLFRRSWVFGSVMALLSLLVAWSRIFLGVHFPFDMGGAFIVAATVVTWVALFWALKGDVIMSGFDALSRVLLTRLPAKFHRLLNRHQQH